MPSDSPSRSRRSLLRSGAVLLGASLAGCRSFSPGETDDRPTTEPPTSTPTSAPTPEPTPTRRPASTSGAWLDVSLEATDARDVALGVRLDDGWLEPYERTLVDRILRADQHTARFIRDPLAETVYLERDGVHYGITRSAEEREDVSVHRFEIEQVSPCRNPSGTTTGADPLALSALTPLDRRAFLRGNRESFASDGNNYCEQATGYAHYPDDAVSESVLIDPEPTFVRYDDDIYRVRFDGHTVWTQTRYRFVADPLGDLSTFTEIVVSRVVWNLDEATLPERQRSYLETLRRVDAFERTGTVPEVAREFHRRVRKHAYDAPDERDYYLALNDQFFRYRYSLAVA